eukprot:gene31173-40531_t
MPKETPFFSYGYPRVLAALKNAVAEQNSSPQLAAYAMYCLAFLAQFDPSLGDAIEMWNRVLNSPKICIHISRPAALVCRGCARILRAPSDRRYQEESYRDLIEAQRLAEENGDFGFACLLQITIAKSLCGLQRYDEAITVTEKLVREIDAAVAATEADPTAISPVTGGRELDPYMMAKVVDMQYSLAAWLFIKAKEDKRKSLVTSARNQGG